MFDIIISFIKDWVDLLWIPLIFAVFPKGQRLRAVLFVLLCVMLLRLQIQFFESSPEDYSHGILPWLHSHIQIRGYFVYGFFIAIFLGLAKYSKDSSNYIYLAASIGFSVLSFVTSSIIMLL